MEIPAEDIYISEDMARYDAACKRILSNKIFLAWLMKYCVEEYRDCEINDIVEHYIENVEVSAVGVEETKPLSGGEHIVGLKNEETSLSEGTSTFDIRFFALAPKSGDFIRIIVNIEAQNKFDPGYPLVRRALYYCSRLIASQNGVEFTGKNFQERGLPCSVGADDAVAVSGCEGQIDIFEQQAAAELHGKIIDG